MFINRFSLLFIVVCLLWLSPRDGLADQAKIEPQGGPELPLIDFIKRSDYLDVNISPDGKHLAARIRDDETVYMVIIRISDREIVGGAKPGNKDEIASVTWINNKRVLLTYAEKHHNFEVARRTGELFAMDIDGKKREMLAGYRAGDGKLGTRFETKTDDKSSHKLLSVLPDDERHILVVEYPWSRSGSYYYDRRERNPIVSKMDIYTGKKTAKETIPYRGARVFANDKGEVNFVTWSADGVSYNGAYRKNKKDSWKDISELIINDGNYLVASDINNAGTKVYLRGDFSDKGISTLYQLDLSSKQLSRVFDNEIDLYGWMSDDQGEPYAALSYPDQSKFHYSKTNPSSPFIKQHKKLAKAFSGQDVWLSKLAKEGSNLVARVSNDTNPGEYYLFDTVTNKADFLWANYSWIDPRRLAKMQPIELAARDGQTLNGYVTAPNGRASDTLKPMVVLPHGGPHGTRDYPFYNAEVQMLASRGYTVLQINFRGSAGYGEQFERAGHKQWGKVMVNDVIDATRWAIKEGYADQDRICIYGASYGGYSSLMSSAKAPDLFSCTIGFVGVYDLRAMKNKGDIPIGFRGRSYLEKVLGSDEQDLIDQSPITHVAKIKSKVLLIHGDKDRRVPSYHSKKMRTALKKVGNAPEWLYVGDAGHGVFSVKNRKVVYEKLLEFLDANIGS